jgi:hypothetical protein
MAGSGSQSTFQKFTARGGSPQQFYQLVVSGKIPANKGSNKGSVLRKGAATFAKRRKGKKAKA